MAHPKNKLVFIFKFYFYLATATLSQFDLKIAIRLVAVPSGSVNGYTFKDPALIYITTNCFYFCRICMEDEFGHHSYQQIYNKALNLGMVNEAKLYFKDCAFLPSFFLYLTSAMR